MNWFHSFDISPKPFQFKVNGSVKGRKTIAGSLISIFIVGTIFLYGFYIFSKWYSNESPASVVQEDGVYENGE